MLVLVPSLLWKGTRLSLSITRDTFLDLGDCSFEVEVFPSLVINVLQMQDTIFHNMLSSTEGAVYQRQQGACQR